MLENIIPRDPKAEQPPTTYLPNPYAPKQPQTTYIPQPLIPQTPAVVPLTPLPQPKPQKHSGARVQATNNPVINLIDNVPFMRLNTAVIESYVRSKKTYLTSLVGIVGVLLAAGAGIMGNDLTYIVIIFPLVYLAYQFSKAKGDIANLQQKYGI